MEEYEIVDSLRSLKEDISTEKETRREADGEIYDELRELREG